MTRGQAPLAWPGLLAYSLMGLPLAMAALPVYVQAPRLYTAELGLPLALAGWVLFGARLIDTAQDPWLGRLADRWQHRTGGWLRLGGLGVAGLMLGLAALLLPPQLPTALLLVWLGVALVLTYTAHSLVNIICLAWGARLTDVLAERTRVTATREGAGLIGVVLASLLPGALLIWMQPRAAWQGFVLVFCLLLGISWLIFRRWSSPPRLAQTTAAGSGWLALHNRAFRRLALGYLGNSLAVSIPATLALFFIADRLQLAAQSGLFLAAYFVSGALGLPLWHRLAARIGKLPAWRVGMALGAAGFVWAVLLEAGDAGGYLAVCILTGLVLGADLALPPALLADVIPESERAQTASYFGIWSLLGKLPLAGAGLTLPLLAWLGYQPGQAAGMELALVYAGLPCLLKLLVLACLRLPPVQGEHS